MPHDPTKPPIPQQKSVKVQHVEHGEGGERLYAEIQLDAKTYLRVAAEGGMVQFTADGKPWKPTLTEEDLYGVTYDQKLKNAQSVYSAWYQNNNSSRTYTTVNVGTDAQDHQQELGRLIVRADNGKTVITDPPLAKAQGAINSAIWRALKDDALTLTEAKAINSLREKTIKLMKEGHKIEGADIDTIVKAADLVAPVTSAIKKTNVTHK